MEAMTLEPCPFCGGKPIPGWGMCHEVQLFNVRCRCGAGANDFDSEDAAAKAWNRRAHLAQPAQAVDVARRFHEAYERLAPSFGYETRPDTRAFDPESPNGKLMTAVCAEVSRALSGEKAGPVGDGLVREALRCVGAFAQFAGTSAVRCDPQAMHLVICEAHHGLSCVLPASPTPDKEGK